MDQTSTYQSFRSHSSVVMDYDSSLTKVYGDLISTNNLQFVYWETEIFSSNILIRTSALMISPYCFYMNWISYTCCKEWTLQTTKDKVQINELNKDTYFHDWPIWLIHSEWIFISFCYNLLIDTSRRLIIYIFKK